MKPIEVTPKKRIVRLACVLMLSLLVGNTAARADAVTDWNEIAVDTAVAANANPFAQGRYAAIVQLAVFEAVNSITREYEPYLGTIARRPLASPDAAAIEASYKVLSDYFGSVNPTIQAALDEARMNSMSAIPDGQAKTDGIQAGDDAAQAMINLRADDGSATPPLTTIPGPAGPGVYQLTTGCKAAIAYNWQFVTPFGIQSASDFMVGPPPALTSEAFTRAFNEVKTVGAIDSTSTERPPDRANVALYFAATSPTQAMNQAAREVAEEQGGSLSENARALALMNMAINDSLVASFLNKYHYNFWRPETAIHTATIAGNPKLVADPGWASFIVTPCFPSYPSNHGSAVNAAGEVLRRLYGEAGHVITLTNTTTPTIILHYNSFTEIDDDVSDARVYGGIHFRTDQEAGSDLGGAIGAAVYRSNLRPRWPLSILPTAERR
ncbi:MAG TPA: vanadium-dependent haloperoxidase [Acidobacteriaceae bacterium]|nr:vanadium-dependent haloperoxidase [Acidobacteriaceae bacterium]